MHFKAGRPSLGILLWTLELDKALLWWLGCLSGKMQWSSKTDICKRERGAELLHPTSDCKGNGLVFQCWLLQQVQMRFSTFEGQTFLSWAQAQILDLSSHANVCAQRFYKDIYRYSLHQDGCGSVWTFSQTMTMSCRDLYCCKLLLRAPSEFFWGLVCPSSIYLLC